MDVRKAARPLDANVRNWKPCWLTASTTSSTRPSLT